MSLDVFQKLDNEIIDNSIEKRSFLKTYHQRGANSNNFDQNVDISFGENNNYQHIGSA